MSAWKMVRPFGSGDLAVLEDSGLGVGVDDGSDHGFGVLGRADLDGSGGLGEPGDEGVVNSFEHDDSRAGRALLTGVAEGALQGPDHGLVEVGVVVDDEGVLAAHLGDHPLDVVLAWLGLGRPAVDLQADGP